MDGHIHLASNHWTSCDLLGPRSCCKLHYDCALVQHLYAQLLVRERLLRFHADEAVLRLDRCAGSAAVVALDV